MTRFWSTLAIVNAVWAATGEVDVGSLVQALLVVWCLLMLLRAEKREQAALLPGGVNGVR